MVASLDKIGRREFLRAGLVFGAGAAGLAAGYAAVPDVFARAMYAAKQEKVVNDKVLVMIQLAGGNDGLQTVIPLADQTYRDMRPQLSKSADEALGFIAKACEAAGHRVGEDIMFALDCASTEFFKDGKYVMEGEGKTLDADETIEFTFAGDKVSRLDLQSADQAAEDAFWG